MDLLGHQIWVKLFKHMFKLLNSCLNREGGIAIRSENRWDCLLPQMGTNKVKQSATTSWGYEDAPGWGRGHIKSKR